MKRLGIPVIVSALLLFGCSSSQTAQAPQQAPQPQLTEEQKAENRKNGLPENFVSVPELKDVMDAMVMEHAATLWSVSGPEDAPKDVDGWTKLDHAAVAMIETMKFLQKSNLTKDQGEWLNKSNTVIDVSNKAREAIKEKNADKLFEVGGELDEACAGCHKIYYAEG
jgi:hypothetical protein